MINVDTLSKPFIVLNLQSLSMQYYRGKCQGITNFTILKHQLVKQHSVLSA